MFAKSWMKFSVRTTLCLRLHFKLHPVLKLELWQRLATFFFGMPKTNLTSRCLSYTNISLLFQVVQMQLGYCCPTVHTEVLLRTKPGVKYHCLKVRDYIILTIYNLK